jgi:mono/diheme cytochrome c family protein
MERNRLLAAAVVLIILGAAGLAATGYVAWWQSDRTRGVSGWWRGMPGRMHGGMMGREEMREMMQGMMGGMLPPGVAPEALPDADSRGARLTARICSQCHDVPSPAFRTAEEWPRVAGRMFARLVMMARMPMMRGADFEYPSPEEREAIVEYLQAHALKPLPGAPPEPGSEGAELFRTACSRCHALPDPALHMAQEWPAVVDRMRGRMREMGTETITDRERDVIVAYLSRHARGQRSRPAQTAPRAGDETLSGGRGG